MFTQRVHIGLVQCLQCFTRSHVKCTVNFVNDVSRFGSLTTCARARGCAASNYPFLTSKERDNETGLDYFGARYYASIQGRFTGADPYDINLERQMTSDPDEAENVFKNYIKQPQHWNHYAYALNNPLRYIDPDGLMEYDTELLGKKINVKISDNLKSEDGKKLKGDDLKAAQEKMKKNIDNAIARINSGNVTPEQANAINSMNGIEVRTDIVEPGMNLESKVFYLTPGYANSEDVDMLAGAIVHDSYHADQKRRGVPSIGREAEKEASAWTLGVLDKIGITDPRIISTYERDAKQGHLPKGEKTRAPKKKTP